jgi:hypothetical protein
LNIFDVNLNEEVTMLIRVMYDDGRFDMVKPQHLDSLLQNNSVTSFKRNEGWVVVGRDAIRDSRPAQEYNGPDRRTLREQQPERQPEHQPE